MTGHRLAAAVALLLLANCGSTPTRVFDLSPAVPSAPVATEPSRSLTLIWVDKPSVAGYFDRTQMVTRGAGSRVSIHEFEVWSDPPADLIQRAVVDDLAHRFGADQVMATPVARNATPGWRVALDVIRFDVDESGDAVLECALDTARGVERPPCCEPARVDRGAVRRRRRSGQAGDGAA